MSEVWLILPVAVYARLILSKLTVTVLGSAVDVSATKDFTKNNWKGKNVLLFGSEGYGIKAKTLENSDFKFKVNMNDNIESLNISNTVSVVCHHIFNSIK